MAKNRRKLKPWEEEEEEDEQLEYTLSMGASNSRTYDWERMMMSNSLLQLLLVNYLCIKGSA
jgi:hypothetical protein